MSEKVAKGGSPHEGDGQQSQINPGEQHSTTMGRPAPINTSIGRGADVPSHAVVTASSSGYSPSVQTGSSVQFTPATSSYSPSIWSAGVGTPMSEAGVTHSATVQTKPSWESSLAQYGGQNAGVAAPSSVAADDTGTVQSSAPSAPPYHLMRGEPGKRYTITFYNENDIPLVNAFPLTLHSCGEYTDANGRPCKLPKKAWVLPAASSNVSAAESSASAPQPPAIEKTGNVNDAEIVICSANKSKDDPATPTNEVTDPSVMSELSAHYLKTRPHLASQAPPVFAQEANGGNFDIQATRDYGPFNEAFPGALGVVIAANPSHLKVQWGARVVCIKTEFVENVQWSIQRGTWVAMNKVGERVTRLWDECHPHGDEVLLLFSVNGQKSYCGLAVMRGPWKEGGSIEGWKERDEDTKVMGSFPVVWSYIKNVSFEYFKDIQHTHNKQPIVNMWNGMHFPSDKGHEVVEIYVRKAHFTNVICWRDDRPYNPYKDVTHPAQLDPRLKTRPNDMTIMKNNIKARQAIEEEHVVKDENVVPSTPGLQSTQRGLPYGIMSSSRRQQPPEMCDTGPTPTIQDRYGMPAGNVGSTPSFDNPGSPSPQPGQRVSVSIEYIVDTDGNYIPVTPTHQPMGGLRIPAGTAGRLPSPQRFQSYSQQLCRPQQASFNDMRSHGAYTGSPRRVNRGRGGGQGQLRGAHSFVNTRNARMQQSGFGRGIPGLMREAHSFHGGGMGHFQQSAADLTSPTVQRMHSEMGIGQGSGMRGNLREATSIPNITPNPAHVKSSQHSTSVLREAVSKPNLFVPMAAVSPQLQATAFKPATTIVDDARAGAAYGPLPSTEDIPSCLPEIRHTPAPTDFASRLKASGAYPVYPTPTDVESADAKAEAAHKQEKLLNDLNKAAIDFHGKVSLIQHEIGKVMTKGDVGSESSRKVDFDSPDFDMDANSSQWDVYEMGSGTTFERRCVSPVRGSDGGILDSVSKHDSPETKDLRRRINHLERHLYGQGSDSSRYGRMKADVDNLVNSPPESVANEKGDEDEVGGGVSLE